MSERSILLAGESWVTVTYEIKGQNVLQDAEYGEAAGRFVETLESTGASVTFQPCHVAAESFPRTREELDKYDVVILSDIGADTLQLTDQVAGGDTDVNRCALLADWVHDGGAIGMIGGYMSFAGKGGKARYAATSLANVLPVEMRRGDDRIETPEGVRPRNVGVPDDDIPTDWPAVLGYNELQPKPDADVWATVRDDPFLVVGDYGEGSAFAYTTDCAPHWAPEPLLEWEYLSALWSCVLDRVDGET